MDLELFVLETSGMDRKASFVSSGVPLPAGAVSDETNLSLWDEREEPVPAQMTVTSRWPDGSIRWVLVEFRVNIKAHGERDFMLTDSYPVSRFPKEPRLKMREEDGCFSFETPALRFGISKNAPEPLMDVSLGANGKVGLLNGPEMKLCIASSLHRKIEARIEPPDRVEVEHSGPEHSTIFRSGTISDERGMPLFRYDHRAHIFAGTRSIRLETSLTQVSREPLLFVNEWLLLFELPSCCVGDYTFGGSRSPHMGDFEETESRHLTPAEAHGWKTATLAQLDASSYSLHHSHKQLRETGTLAPGWVDLRGVEFGLTAGIGNFWQEYPKSLSVRGDGTLVLGLWPCQSLEPCRFERGSTKTHEVFLYFHPEETDPAECEKVFADFLDPLFAVASPEWYAESGAFGELTPFDPLAFPEFDRAEHLGGASRLPEPPYGAREYGVAYTVGTKVEEKDRDDILTHVVRFARTGARSHLNKACTRALHEADLHVCHVTGHYLSQGPMLTLGLPDLSSARVGGLLSLYQLTGRKRFREAAEKIGEWVRGEIEAPLSYFRSDRLIGSALIALNHLFRETGERKYLESAGSLVRRLAAVRTESGQFECITEDSGVRDVGLSAMGIAGYAELSEDANAAETAQEHMKCFLSREPDPEGTTLPGLVWAYRILGESKYLDIAQKTYLRAVREADGGIPYMIVPYLVSRKERGLETPTTCERPIDVSRFGPEPARHCASLSGQDSITFLWDCGEGLEILVQRIGGTSEGLATLSASNGREILSLEFPPSKENETAQQRVIHFASTKPGVYVLEFESGKKNDICAWQLWSAMPFRWVRKRKDGEVVAPAFLLKPETVFFHVQFQAQTSGQRHLVLWDPLNRPLAAHHASGKVDGKERSEISVTVPGDLPPDGVWRIGLCGYQARIPEALPYFAVSSGVYFNPEKALSK